MTTSEANAKYADWVEFVKEVVAKTMAAKVAAGDTVSPTSVMPDWATVEKMEWAK
jgi:hypothetical protein